MISSVAEPAVQLHDEQATAKLAEKLAPMLYAGVTIGLSGSLGAGKTTFVRYLLAALGSADPVSSPTYVLEHEYHSDRFSVSHWDLYRCAELPQELYEPPSGHQVRLIEWFERFGDELGALDLTLRFSLLCDHVRTVSCGGLAQDIVRHLSAP